MQIAACRTYHAITSRDRGDGYHESACYAEAVVAAEEYHVWARAASVGEYLELRSTAADFPVVRNDKLAEHWIA